MTWFAGQCLLLIGLFLGTCLSGVAFLKLAGPKFLLLRRAEQQALCPIVGTAAWMLLFGLCSHLGFRAGIGAAIVMSLSLLLVVLTWKRHPDILVWHPRMAPLTLAAALAAVLCLLPIYFFDIYYINNDTWLYMVLSDWMQTHGFGQAAEEDPYDPFVAAVRIWQTEQLRVGPSFLLALVQAVLFIDRALLVYPAVMAWGFVLFTFAVFIFARWCLRLRFGATIALTIAIAISMYPIRWDATNGFLSSMYGGGALFTTLALLARLVYRRTRSGRDGLMIGFLGAYLLSACSEMFPVLGVVGLVFLLVGGLHAHRHHVLPRFIAHMAIAACCFLAFANIEILRAYHAIQIQMERAGGFFIPLTPLEYWSAAMGQHHFMIYPQIEVSSMEFWSAAATLVMTVLFIVGLPIALRRDRTRLYVTTFAVLIFLLVKFGLRPDPMTGYHFYTYVFFKVIQWATPVLAVTQFAGLEAVGVRLSHLPFPGPQIAGYLPRVILGFLIVIWLPAHVREAKEAWQGLSDITMSRAPYAALNELALKIDQRRWDTLYLLPSVTGGGWPHLMYAYFLHPRPIGADWRGSQYVETGYSRLPIPPKSNSLYLFLGTPRWCDTMHQLPANVTLLQEKRPCLLDVSQATSLDGSRWTSLSLFSPSNIWVRLTARLSSQFTKPVDGFIKTNSFITVRAIRPPDQFLQDIPLNDSADMELVLLLNEGMTEIDLIPLDKDHRPLVVFGRSDTSLVNGNDVRVEALDPLGNKTDDGGSR